MLLAFLRNVRLNEFSHLMCYKNQGSTGTFSVHSWYQKSCIRRKQFSLRSHPWLLVKCCYYPKSGDESCPSQAKIHHGDFRSHAYNRSNWDWSQRNRRFFSVHPPPAVVWSQKTSKADWLSGLMKYTPSLFSPDLKILAQFLKAGNKKVGKIETQKCFPNAIGSKEL